MRYADKDGTENQRSANGARALETAIEKGVNFIHSSYEYKTRWLTGPVLKRNPRRHELHHIIKVNVPEFEEPRFNVDSFRRQIEQALEELGTERIEVVQHLQRGVPRSEMMTPATDKYRLEQFDEIEGEIAEIAGKMKQEGKIGTVMSFPYTVAFARRVVESPVYSGLVAYFNPLETEMVEFFDRLEELGKDYITIRPLCQGILTDKRADRKSLPAEDRMKSPNMDDLYRRFETVRRALGEPGMPWEQFAFRFSLIHPVIKSSVLGITVPEHLKTAEGPDLVSGDLLAKALQANQEFDVIGQRD
jgi:aryl-alcohol dehydrogenase-like predicted oxidoreductase